MIEPLDEEHTRRTALALHERGVEMSHDEIHETRKRAFDKIRVRLREMGVECPDDDQEFFLFVWLLLHDVPDEDPDMIRASGS